MAEPIRTRSTAEERTRRWEEEAHFFDLRAAEVDDADLLLDPLALARYRRIRLRKRFNKEFRFHVLAPLRGKKVLDIGCGDGVNSVLFARMGAYVTGLDISAGAIEVARRRASVNGVTERATFVCAPAEVADLEQNAFDIVWGDAILHHVLGDLDAVLRQLSRACKPSGLMLFSEPVNRANFLRKLRTAIPVHTDATPDERPLIGAELRLLKRYIVDLRMRPYALLGRLDRFAIPDHNYEHASYARKVAVNLTAAVDYILLSVPLVDRLGGEAVLYGHPRKTND